MQLSASDCQTEEEKVPRFHDHFGDAQYLFKIAESYLPALNEKCRRAGKLTTRRRAVHIIGRVGQWIPRKLKEIIQNHWDLGVFDIGFGSIKAFGVYPALYFAGFAWTIPIMEYVPLNTQLWTAGYMFCRRHCLSAIGKLRYGHSLNRMNAHRDGVLKIHPRDVRHIHRFDWESTQYVVRIRRSRFRSWLRKMLGRRLEPNVVHQSNLRGMISDKEFIFQASLVVFPEGEIHHLNQRLVPLLDGVAFMAHSAQRQLSKDESSATIWIIPAAIRYRFDEDVQPRIEEAMANLEKRMFWSRPPGEPTLRQRILHFGDMLLTIKEKEKLGRSCESDGDLPTRIQLLLDRLLIRHEETYLNKAQAGKTVALRVKALRRSLLDLRADEKTDESARERAGAALEDVQMALQLYSYPGNYISSDDDIGPMAETIEKFYEDVYGLCICMGRRRARIVFGAPINMREATTAGRTRAVIEKVTDELEDRIEKLLVQAGEGEW